MSVEDDLVSAAKRIYSEGLVRRGEGNLSVRTKDGFCITPTLNDYAKLSKGDLVYCTYAGQKTHGLRNPSSEWPLHAHIYSVRENANCVIHTHSPNASSLSVLRRGIPVIFEEMLIFLGGAVTVSEYARANTENLPESALSAMGDTNSAILANHGTVVCGKTIEDAVASAVLVEKMAGVYLRAVSAGKVFEVPQSSRLPFLQKFKDTFSTK